MAESGAEGPEGVTGKTREVNLYTAEHAACPQPIYAELAASCPVATQALTGGPIISRYEDVIWALRHPEIFSSAMEVQMSLGTDRPMIPQQIDPPAQTRYRKLLDPQFSRKKMALLEPAVRQRAHELIDGFVDDGRCEFNHQFAVPLPCSAFLTLMGLPQSDLPLFLRLKDGIIRPQNQLEQPTPETLTEQRKKSGREIYDYFGEVIAERRQKPGNDMVSYLVQAEMDGERLSHEEILDVSFLLILAGLDTVTATIGCNIAYLAANPEQRERLVRDPSLIPSAIEELMRWETPVTGVPRVVKQDVTIAGVEIEAGQLVTLLLGASNVDPREFPEPESVDFGRERNRHIAFGSGPHRCLGSHLARMELQVAMEVWHQRVPRYEIQAGETPTYSPGIREVLHLPLVWGE